MKRSLYQLFSLAFWPKRVLRSLLLGAALTSPIALLGCSGSPARDGEHETTGSLAVRLSLPDGVTLSSLEYRITGNGIVPIAGSVPVSDSSTGTFRVGGVPAGEEYTIEVTSSTGYGEACSGSALFDIIPNETSRVAVPVECETASDTSDVRVDVEVSRCARVTGISASSLEAPIGGVIELDATASIPGASFTWGAPAGELVDEGSANAAYSCTEPGEHVLTLAVSGGGSLCSEPDTRTLGVTCLGEASTLTGSVGVGPARSAVVEVFLVHDGVASSTPLASTITAEDGSYRVELDDRLLAGDTAEVLVTATGGVYCSGGATTRVDAEGECPRGRPASLDIPLLALARIQRGGKNSAPITPISTAALGGAGGPGGTVPSFAEFEARYSALADGARVSDPLDALEPHMERIYATQGVGASLSQLVSNIRSGLLKGVRSSEPSRAFSIVQSGEHDLAGAEPGALGNQRYFEPRENIDLERLLEIMEDDANGVAIGKSIVTRGHDVYHGYPLADVIVRATRLRPMGTQQDGRMALYFGGSVSIAARGAEGRVAVYSFSELVRSESGAKTLLVTSRNGRPLPPSEGAFAVLALGDDDLGLRFIPRLKRLEVRNDYDPSRTGTTGNPVYTSGTPEFVQFPVQGQVLREITVTAGTLGPTGYYGVDKIGDKPASGFPTYFFHNLGPGESATGQGRYYWGQGIRLSDVLDEAGLAFPEDKGACFVVVDSRSRRTGIFSCGELYNSLNGRGDGAPGEDNRSRSKGTLLVTDDLRVAWGTGPTSCTNYSSCNLTEGDPAASSSYSLLDSQADLMNDRFIAVVNTEDTLPFTPNNRWFYWNTSVPAPVIAPGERHQLGVTFIKVIYAGPDGTGNFTP